MCEAAGRRRRAGDRPHARRIHPVLSLNKATATGGKGGVGGTGGSFGNDVGPGNGGDAAGAARGLDTSESFLPSAMATSRGSSASKRSQPISKPRWRGTRDDARIHHGPILSQAGR
jgi:hypothetical protein